MELDQNLKLKIFFSANAFVNEDIVIKLKSLGMDKKPLFWPGPSIIARDMDFITTRNVIRGFLKDLRKDCLLLTAEEFNKLDKNKYISKQDQIGRILGKNFLEKIAKENRLKHIKVPKKIAVINEGLESISFRANCNLEIIPKKNQLEIYAEFIKDIDRKLSLDEAIEFMIILEKTGYVDFFRYNFIFAEDGIYFIDTEYKDFAPANPQFEVIKNIENLVDPKDVKKFLEEYEKRKEDYNSKKDLHEAQKKEYIAAFKNPYTQLSTGYVEHEFAFQLDSLL